MSFAQLDIRDRSGEDSCVADNGFCPSWIADNLDRYVDPFWQHVYLTLVSLAIGFAIAFGTGNDFLGYSGWGPGQLDADLDQDSWIVCDYVTDQLLFDTGPEIMWRKALENMGGRFSMYSNYPVDPRLN